MAYAEQNFKTKKALREAVAERNVPVFQLPGGMFPLDTSRGRVALEGPHYPQAHTWYADVPVAIIEGVLCIPQGSKIK